MHISQVFTMSVVCRFISLLALVSAPGCTESDDVLAPDAGLPDAELSPQPLDFPRCACPDSAPCDATAYCGRGTVCEGGGPWSGGDPQGICYLSCATSADCDMYPGWDTCVVGHCYPG